MPRSGNTQDMLNSPTVSCDVCEMLPSKKGHQRLCTQRMCCCCCNSHPRICLLILEREEGIDIERNMDQLPPVCAPTMDQTHNPGMLPHRTHSLLVHRPVLQPTEPPSQGPRDFIGEWYVGTLCLVHTNIQTQKESRCAA